MSNLQIAERISDLINSKPRSPTIHELLTILDSGADRRSGASPGFVQECVSMQEFIGGYSVPAPSTSHETIELNHLGPETRQVEDFPVNTLGAELREAIFEHRQAREVYGAALRAAKLRSEDGEDEYGKYTCREVIDAEKAMDDLMDRICDLHAKLPLQPRTLSDLISRAEVAWYWASKGVDDTLWALMPRPPEMDCGFGYNGMFCKEDVTACELIVAVLQFAGLSKQYHLEGLAMATKAKNQPAEAARTESPQPKPQRSERYYYQPAYAEGVAYLVDEATPLIAGCKAILMLFEKGKWVVLAAGTISTKSFPNVKQFRFQTDQAAIDDGYFSGMNFPTSGLTDQGFYEGETYRVHRVVQSITDI